MSLLLRYIAFYTSHHKFQTSHTAWHNKILPTNFRPVVLRYMAYYTSHHKFQTSPTALHGIIYFSPQIAGQSYCATLHTILLPQISNDSYCATLHNILRNLRGFAIFSDASLDSSLCPCDFLTDVYGAVANGTIKFMKCKQERIQKEEYTEDARNIFVIRNASSHKRNNLTQRSCMWFHHYLCDRRYTNYCSPMCHNHVHIMCC